MNSICTGLTPADRINLFERYFSVGAAITVEYAACQKQYMFMRVFVHTCVCVYNHAYACPGALIFAMCDTSHPCERHDSLMMETIH